VARERFQPPAAEGDREIFEKYAPAVRRFCLSRTTTESDAEDAVQDTFLRFLRRTEGDINNLEAWLIRAASYACRDLYRRPTHQELGEAPGLDTEVDPEAIALGELWTSDLLVRLRPEDRELLMRLYVGGWSAVQIAASLNVPPSTVRVMALRARRRAREVLDQMRVAGVAGDQP
jgi:RNA polymerase sigma-70 factor (ECF subfamily)